MTTIGRSSTMASREEEPSSSRSSRMSILDVAGYLGVTRQRVSQLSRRDGFPEPVRPGEERPTWDRADIESWAGLHWIGTRPWRTAGRAASARSVGLS